MTGGNVIYLAPFMRRAEPAEPPRTAGELRLIDQAHEIAAAALRDSTAHTRGGNPRLAKERLLTASADLMEMWLDCQLDEIDDLSSTLIRRAEEIRLPRRAWRQRPGSVVGWLR